MDKIRAAVVGYGNIGKYVVESLIDAPDFEITGIVRRNTTEIPSRLKGFNVVNSVSQLKDTDVALLCTPTRSVEQFAMECLSLGISTVDSYDIHGGIVALRRSLDEAAKRHHAVSIISAGWDPGSDSVIRALMEAMAPKGITYTNFGPGMSMGHTVAVKAIDGVKSALSMTIPTGTGVHRRMVYIELKDGYDFEQVAQAIKADDYFAHDETHVPGLR
jgi:diaminopimelate dehydrogenase